MTNTPFRLAALLLCLILGSACRANVPPFGSAAISATPTTLPAVAPTSTAVRAAPPSLPPPSTLPTAAPTFVPPKTVTDMRALTEQLVRAAEAGDTLVVQRLVEQGADINGRDARGRTPVMAATHGNRVDTVQALIRAGADINIRDNQLDNPFLYAGAEGRLEILKLAIEAKADTRLTNRFGGTALIPAAERGHVEIVTELLTRTDVDVNHVNNLGWTALLEAIVLSDGGEKHQQIVQLLVDHGADIMIADKNGVTPLRHAQARGFKEIERILSAASAQPDARPGRARDLRMIAAAGRGDLETVRQLLAQGANVHT